MPDGKTRVIFCDVGQGDGALIIKNNFQMLIDAGPKNNKMAECLGRYMPFWDKTIEVFIASHGDKDHVGGLEAIKKGYRIDREINYSNVDNGDIVRYKDIDFVILNNDELSMIGKLKYGNKSILFTGDAGVVAENSIDDKVDILKVGHHGSDTSTGEAFLNRINPQIAVISVGKNNSYGHPKKIIVDRLLDRGIEIRRTDLMGDIVVNSF
jgi:competence protein ComEC